MTATSTLSKGQKQAADVAALLRARNPLIWVVTREEARVEGFLAEAAASAGYLPRFWDVAQGVTDLSGKVQRDLGSADPADTMNAIKAKADAPKGERGVWVFRDLPVWLQGPAGAAPMRQLRNLSRFLPSVGRDNAQAVIIITTSTDIPAELAGHATVIEWSLPDRTEIAAILDAAINSLPEKDNDGNALRANAAPNGTRDLAIDAAIGLTGEEAASCYARSLVQTRKIDPAIVSNEKRRIIARERVLEWFDPLPGGLAAVGGLDNLKTWAVARKLAYTPAARAYGLKAPKGVFLAGITGCGKSLFAKAIATEFGVPLLKVDLGALKSKFVGDSEQNLRKAFKVIEAIGRCVVWFDEVEKALQGATSGSADGGVSSDALGAILTWMQERSGEAFVVATANDIEGLPPEFLRKGRFDELFFADLPSPGERVAVLKAALTEFDRADLAINHTKVAQACIDFTGAEIAAIVPDALFAAYADNGRELTTDDLIAAADTVVPIATTAKDKIAKLRDWAATRARSASSKAVASVTDGSRKLDLA